MAPTNPNELMKSVFFPICGLLLATVFLLAGPGQGVAQETGNAGAAPLVSPSALDAVSSPAKTSARASASGTVSANNTDPTDFPGKTDLDDPGSTDPRLQVPVDEEGKVTVAKLSKIDLDADLNYDGAFNNDSSSGQGVHEFVPPGLEIGTGELTRLLVRFKSYEPVFPGKLVVSLEVAGINRDAVTGFFEGDSAGAVGRIRVWRDQARKELLLDSGDTSKLRFEWTYDGEQLSGGIPRTIYLEGVKVSPKSEGDLRLLVVSTQVAEGSDSAAPGSLYQSAFDHLLVTVRDEPAKKEFINNNVEQVWSMVDAPNPPQAAEGKEEPDGAQAPR